MHWQILAAKYSMPPGRPILERLQVTCNLVVFELVDFLALFVLGMLNVGLLLGTDVAVLAGAVFLAIHPYLPGIKAAYFPVGQGAVLDAIFNALVLVDVALHISLHAL